MVAEYALARFKLYPQNESSLVIDDGKSQPAQIHQARLKTWVRIDGEQFLRQMLIDTGASLSLFTKQAWMTFRSQIDWIQFSPIDFPRAVSRTRRAFPEASILGGRFPFRLGRIVMKVTDLDKQTGFSAPVPLIAKFLEDANLPRYQVLGLRDGILQQLKLMTQPSLNDTGFSAWLEEMPVA